MEILMRGTKMRLCAATLILLLFSVVLPGCPHPFRLPGDPVYYLCAFMKGTVVDSSTHEPLAGGPHLGLSLQERHLRGLYKQHGGLPEQ